jgi:CDP-diacylglycerol---glycerol-3-phosphate 3-phosphatidyltransferase
MTTVQRTGTASPGTSKDLNSDGMTPASAIRAGSSDAATIAIAAQGGIAAEDASAIPTVWNIPNFLTTIRFMMSIAVIGLIAQKYFMAAMVTFLVAASTDWMDGYYARKYGQVTKFGRIFDPFVDKIIICGAFIALVALENAGVPAWMAIVVVARELLVTSLRGIIEGAGKDFSASWLGKWKMVFQCVAVVAVLMCLVVAPASYSLEMVRTASLWIAMGLTVYSGIDYVVAAARVLGSSEGGV